MSKQRQQPSTTPEARPSSPANQSCHRCASAQCRCSAPCAVPRSPEAPPAALRHRLSSISASFLRECGLRGRTDLVQLQNVELCAQIAQRRLSGAAVGAVGLREDGCGSVSRCCGEGPGGGNGPTGFSSMMLCTFCFAAAETMVLFEVPKKRRKMLKEAMVGGFEVGSLRGVAEPAKPTAVDGGFIKVGWEVCEKERGDDGVMLWDPSLALALVGQSHMHAPPPPSAPPCFGPCNITNTASATEGFGIF
jgi:hypothetical protein